MDARLRISGLVLAAVLAAAGCAKKQPPAAVTLHGPSDAGYHSLTLSWTGSADAGFKNYLLFYGASPQVDQTATLAARLSDPAGLTFQVVGLDIETTYYFRVMVENARGQITPSNEVSGMTLSWATRKTEMVLAAQTLFTHLSYNAALTAYQEISGLFPADPAGYEGAGWCQARLGEADLALASFETALTRQPDDRAAQVGLAGILEARKADGDLPRAIGILESVLAADAACSLAVYGVTNREIRLTLAACCLLENDLPAAQAQVDAVDPGNGLDPASATYAQDLIAKVRELRME